jgi:hypothetical protein
MTVTRTYVLKKRLFDVLLVRVQLFPISLYVQYCSTAHGTHVKSSKNMSQIITPVQLAASFFGKYLCTTIA